MKQNIKSKLPSYILLKRLLMIFTMFVFVFGQANTVLAAPIKQGLPESEIKALEEYPNWVADKCAIPVENAPEGSIKPGSIYIMGDSITAMAKDTYKQKFASPWSPTVEGLGSRQIDGGIQPDGVAQITKDKAVIGQANAIVIALGTNGTGNSAATTKNNVEKLMTELKKANTKNAPVFWVNVLDTRNDGNTKTTNRAIRDALNNDAAVIDWYSAAKGIGDYAQASTKANLSTFNEGVHPGPSDIKLLVDTVYDEVTQSAGTTSPTDVEYISAGNITESGMKVGATTYGGVYKDGKWGPSNNVQGGSTPYDDNGVNSYNNKPIAGHTAFAELGGGKLLGDLPYQKDGKPNTKLQITYKGKSIIAEKMDIGTGQVGNDHYKVDLWWETAKLLGVKDNADIKIHVVPADTPVTPLDGSPSDDNAKRFSSDPDCQCGGNAESPDESTITNGSFEHNLKAIFEFFVSNGFTKNQAAGVVGNVYAESGGNPESYEGVFDQSFKVPPGKKGYGIVGWTPSTKITEYAASVNKKPGDLSTQLEFLLKQLNGEAGAQSVKVAGDDLRTTKTVEEAVRAFQGDKQIGGKYIGFERPADESGSLAKRIRRAELALRQWGGDVSGGTSAASSSEAETGATCQCSIATDSDSNLVNKLKDLAEKNGGKTSISAASVNGDIKGDANGKNQMPTRSSYKLYTTYATLKAIEDGKITWSTDVWGGKSVEATMKRMIINSDNYAATALRTNNTIGSPGVVTNLLQDKVGLSSKTIMGTGGSSNSNTQSTSDDYVKFLLLLQKKKLPGVDKDSSYDKLLAWMKQATTDGGSARAGIAAGVGGGTTVADKPGWSSSASPTATNDVGIVYLDNNPYVIAILTDKPAQWSKVADIAKAVNETMNGKKASTGGDEANCASDGGGAVAGDAAKTAVNYAWPSYHLPNYYKFKPAYKTAVEKAQKDGRFVGGGVHPGIDCGGFVTTVMHDSGADKDYNKGRGDVTGQHNYIKSSGKYKLVRPSSTADLEPGDIYISNSEGHTLMYVGKQDGFSGIYASSSYGGNSGTSWRTPMADRNKALYTEGYWYRLK